MLKKYCHGCGSPTEYTLNLPRFCSCCGESFEEGSRPPSKNTQHLHTQQPTITPKQKVIYSEEYDDENDLLDFDDFRDSIKAEVLGNRTLKIGDIANTRDPKQVREEYSSRKIKKANKKTLLNEIKKEASSKRK